MAAKKQSYSTYGAVICEGTKLCLIQARTLAEAKAKYRERIGADAYKLSKWPDQFNIPPGALVLSKHAHLRLDDII